MFWLYNGLVLLLLPLILLYVLVRWGGRFSQGLAQWNERWGHLPREIDAALQHHGDRQPWWVHAVSVGEVKAIEAFLRALQAGPDPHRVLLTLVTPEAIAYARERKLADAVVAAPIDLPWIVRRVFRRVRPELFISVESEFWPNLLREARRSGARVALINGRMSAHSFGSYSKVPWLLSPLWACFDLMAVREPQDAERFAALGVPLSLVQITGNLKYDQLDTTASAAAHAGRVIVFGSTREGEEAMLLPVAERLRSSRPDVRIIWAPRHLKRVAELERLLANTTAPARRKSQLSPTAVPGEQDTPPYVVWDTMGDLISAYRRADVAVIGGSFVSKGGQNPIEPAALGVPVVFGPSMENFTAISQALVAGGGAKQVTLAELEPCLEELLDLEEVRRATGERARKTVEAQRGATERTIRLLDGLSRA
jgi:3-deoxy-D-manno-octulosonic-acid transferase